MSTISLSLPINRQNPMMGDFYFDEPPVAVHHRHSILASRMPKPPRLTNSPEPLITLKPSPRTSAEWKLALAEVKRDYINRKYRACYTRCNELVESTKTHSAIAENAHLIYIRFYAASAIEMQVRTLQQNSSFRTKLLLQAREHYRAASELAAAEDASMSRPSSRSFSPVPSLQGHSPSSSSDTGRSTRIPSPSPSLSSLDSCLKSATRRSTSKPKKRVAFIDVPACEPVIRPDSPTLGFDDWFSRSPSPELVAPQKPHRLSPPAIVTRASPPLPSPTLSIASTASSACSSPSDVGDDEPIVDSFLRQRSVHHYCGVLASLQRQISSHLAWIDQDITAALAPHPPTIMTDEMRALELRTRIERLRANGWQRKRFDAQRYEALRESALADI